tara:strand:+ start:510 stop:662 length:153 start_codon:yes stop_codon:yes gene_type:complete
MRNLIVMKSTIDHLASLKQFSKIDSMMGSGDDWEKVEMKNESTYYKKPTK